MTSHFSVLQEQYLFNMAFNFRSVKKCQMSRSKQKLYFSCINNTKNQFLKFVYLVYKLLIKISRKYTVFFVVKLFNLPKRIY